MEQLELDVFPGRADTLYKLLAVEPDTLEALAMATGWGTPCTRKALLQLIAEGRVICRNRNYQPTFFVRASTQVHQSTTSNWSK